MVLPRQKIHTTAHWIEQCPAGNVPCSGHALKLQMACACWHPEKWSLSSGVSPVRNRRFRQKARPVADGQARVTNRVNEGWEQSPEGMVRVEH